MTPRVFKNTFPLVPAPGGPAAPFFFACSPPHQKVMQRRRSGRTRRPVQGETRSAAQPTHDARQLDAATAAARAPARRHGTLRAAAHVCGDGPECRVNPTPGDRPRPPTKQCGDRPRPPTKQCKYALLRRCEYASAVCGASRPWQACHLPSGKSIRPKNQRSASGACGA